MTSLPRVIIILPLLLVGVLVACQSADISAELSVSVTPSASSTPEPSATTVATGTPTASATRTPLPTSFPATPPSQPTLDVFSAPIGDGLFYSGEGDCALPCWYDLRVGESDTEEVQIALRQALGLHEDYVFAWYRSRFQDPPEMSLLIWRDYSQTVDDFQVVGVEAFFDVETAAFIRLEVNTTNPYFMQQTTPQIMLREMGAPAAVWVSFSQNPHKLSLGEQQSVFVYPDKGIVFEANSSFPVHVSLDFTISDIGQWCLNGRASQNGKTFWMTVTEPFGIESYLPPDRFYVSLEERLDITLEELYQRAIQDNNVCLSIEY